MMLVQHKGYFILTVSPGEFDNKKIKMVYYSYSTRKQSAKIPQRLAWVDETFATFKVE